MNKNAREFIATIATPAEPAKLELVLPPTTTEELLRVMTELSRSLNELSQEMKELNRNLKTINLK